MGGYTKSEHYNEAITTKLASSYKLVLAELGENPMREGLLKTPERVAKAM